jgi:hypothetical protein
MFNIAISGKSVRLYGLLLWKVSTYQQGATVMNRQDDRIKVSAIPRTFYESVTRHIINFAIGIVKVLDTEKAEDAILIGSGTLVDLEGIYGILTAQHVIDALPSMGQIGFIISENLHKYTLDAQTLAVSRIGRGKDSGSGPDLGLIHFPRTAIGSIKAKKSFYSIAGKRDRMINSPPEDDFGVWCICGIPDVETKSEGPSKGFDQVKAFLHFCGFGGISRSFSTYKFDYFDFEAHYNEPNESPSSFGGVSGGGLWQIIIAQKPDGEFLMKEALLSGVAFYQTDLIENKRIIKCHGRKSIYEIVYQTIKKTS